MINEDDSFKHHKKKKKRDSVELHAEESSNYDELKLKHHKNKKKKEKAKLFAEPYVDSNKNVLKQLKKKKKKKKKKSEKSDLSQEFQSDNNTDQNLSQSETCTTSYATPNFGYKHKYGKKHKKEKESNLNEMEAFAIEKTEVSSQRQNKSKIHSHVGEAEISNEAEVSIKSKKKHKKCKENSDISNDVEVCVKSKNKHKKCKKNSDIFNEVGVRLKSKNKHNKCKDNLDISNKVGVCVKSKKKHKKCKENSDISNKVGVCVKSKNKHKKCKENSDICNEARASLKSRNKHKKCKDNSHVSEILDEPGIMSKKQKKTKHQMSHAEPNNDCCDLEINSSNHRGKKRKVKNFYVAQASAILDELELLLKKRKKQKKNSDNAEDCVDFNQHGFISNNSLNETLSKNKEISLNAATEVDNDYKEFEINSSDHHREKYQENNLNAAEASPIDKTETFLKKCKKKKKHLDNTKAYTILNQHISYYSSNEDNLRHKESNLNVAESNTLSNKPDMWEKYKKKQKTNHDCLHTSNFNTETDELNDKLSADSRNKKHLMTDCDESAINHKKHKKKHKKDKDYLNCVSKNDVTSLNNSNIETDELNDKLYAESRNKSNKKYLMTNCDESAINHKKHKKKHKKDKDYLNCGVSNNDVTNLEFNTQCANNIINMFPNSTVDDCDTNLRSKQKKNSKNKKKDKRNIENSNVKKAHENENLGNLKQNFTDNTLSCNEIDISDILLNKEISQSPVILHSIKNKSNHSDNGTTDETFHSPVHKHKQKNKHKQLENSALITSKFNDDKDSYSHNQINNKTDDNTDYTDEHLQNITDEDTQHSTKFRNFASDERTEFTYFSSDVDCNEDPVNFEVPPLHKFETVHRLNEKQKNDLLESGVFIKTGKFTAAEDKIIQKNFNDFVKRVGVSDSFDLFGIGRYSKDTELLKFLKAKHFYVRLAKDLNDRSLYNVYRRARMILHPFKNTGKLTEKEVDHLKRLHVTHPKKWQLIGDTLGTTADRCTEAYRWHKKDIAKGKFTEEERTQLIEPLQEILGSSDISCKNMKGINWDAVASHLPSRNGSQCRMYWAYYLGWAPGSAKKKWNEQCVRKLVNILKELNVENSSKIDWYKVYESFEDFAPSDLYVQKRWLYLRSRIPNYKDKSHKEIIDRLSKKYSL